MKKIILIFLAVIYTGLISAQDEIRISDSRPLNCITASFLGDGSNVSLNYERLIFLNDYLFISARVGAGYGRQLTFNNPDTINPPVYLTIPVQITLNAGKRRHFAELGIGNSVTIGDVHPHDLYYLTGGYRFYPLYQYNLSIRIFGNWLFNNPDEFRNLYFIPFGLSLGYAF